MYVKYISEISIHREGQSGSAVVSSLKLETLTSITYFWSEARRVYS